MERAQINQINIIMIIMMHIIMQSPRWDSIQNDLHPAR